MHVTSTSIALTLAISASPASPVYAQQTSTPITCNQPSREPIVHLPIDGHPFDVITSRDGCWVFVSVIRDSGVNGVTVFRRMGGEIKRVGLARIDGAALGMVLTRDEKTLVVAGGTQVAFVDVAKLTSGQDVADVSYLSGTGFAGGIMVNVTSDDRYLFVSQELAAAITVIELPQNRDGFSTSRVIGAIPTGRAPISLVFSANQRYLFSTSQEAPKALGWPIDCRPQANRAAAPDHSNGAVVIIDVEHAKKDPSASVRGIVRAGCNPVRLALSADGNSAYVTARGDDELLVFEMAKMLTNSANALIARVPVGTAPVGVAVIDRGTKVVVTNSNRFAGGADDRQHLTVIDAGKITGGADAVLGTIPAGAFPRQMHVTADGRTLLVTNYASGTLQVIDVARLPVQSVAK